MLHQIKKLIPAPWFQYYHLFLAYLAAWRYANPSNELIVIGVTGTNGKSTTVMMIARMLEGAGFRVGATSTALFKIAEREWLNDQKMTMLGRFQLQKMLRAMVNAKCQYAVIETSSQGIEQFRHIGINFDVAVFTNLTPEHIEAHGGFENYKKAKLKLFKKISTDSHKYVFGEKIEKTIIANRDSDHADDFLNYSVDEKITFGINSDADVKAEDIIADQEGISFVVDNQQVDLQLFGRFNIYNALAVLAVAESQDIDLPIAAKALAKIETMPGRFEFVTHEPFAVLVDYAYEPEGLRQCYQAIKDHQLVAPGNKLIHLLGSCGGGRDVARRPILGQMAGETAQIVIVTNEDPYDDNPEEIITNVAKGAIDAGKIINQNLFTITDRREAIAKAFSLAQPGDLVLLTGKGSEQVICVAGGKKIKWDERQVARELLSN